MRCVDVNVYAHRPESPQHLAYRTWVEDARSAREPMGLMGAGLTGFVPGRDSPTDLQHANTVDVALEFVDKPRPFAADVKGRHVSDAVLAATAIEAGATLISADRGFARYPGLRLQHPLDD